MFFSYNKAMMLRPKKEKWLSTFFFALLIGAAVTAPYILTNIGYSTASANTAIGQISMLFVPSASLAGDYKLLLMDKYGMVFGSLLGFVTLLPEWLLPYIFGALTVLRVAFSALTAYFFIRRFVRTPEAARLGAFLYAFSSGIVGVCLGNALQNSVCLFPLILLAAEKLLTENRKMWLFATVFLLAILNGYALWSIGVFLFIYLTLRLTSRDVKASAAVILRLCLEILLGVLLAAVMLVPLAYICIAKTFSVFDFAGLESLFSEGSYLAILRAFWFPAESVNNPVVLDGITASGGLFGAYIPLISLSGVIAFCGAKKGSSFKRIIITSLVFLCVPVLNSLFSIVNPSAQYMWFYMPTLIFALVSVMALEDIEISLSSGLKWSAFVTVILSAIIMLYPNDTDNGIKLGLYSDATDKSGLIRFSIYAVIAILGIIATSIACKMSENRSPAFFNALALCTGVFAAVSMWLYIATEITYYQKSLLSSYYVNVNSNYLSTDGLELGKILFYSQFISIAALGGVLIYIIFCVATRKDQKETECEYPEGDALLKKWAAVENEDYLDFAEEEEDEGFSLESIAENLKKEYPVNYNSQEFTGGFNIVVDISEEKSIDNKEA